MNRIIKEDVWNTKNIKNVYMAKRSSEKSIGLG